MSFLDDAWTGVGNLAGAGFGYLTAAAQARSQAEAARYQAQAEAARAEAQYAASVTTGYFATSSQNRLLIAGMIVAAIVVLFRIRPTANSG